MHGVQCHFASENKTIDSADKWKAILAELQSTLQLLIQYQGDVQGPGDNLNQITYFGCKYLTSPTVSLSCCCVEDSHCVCSCSDFSCATRCYTSKCVVKFYSFYII